MPEEEKGLPMTAKWDPQRLAREEAELQELQRKPFVPRAAGYIKRTGPGLLQSAMTLGAGSAAASVVAGASFGYKLLWVQPLAMFLGVMMLAALGNVVLTKGERPYKAFGREIGKTLVFLWALGTIMSSIIWHFPQYTLAGAAIRDLGSIADVTPEVSFVQLPDGTYLTRSDEEGVASVRSDLQGGDSAKVKTGVSQDEWAQAVKQAEADEKNAVEGPKAVSSSIFTWGGIGLSFLVGAIILSINIFTVFSYGSSTRGIKLYEWFLRMVIALIVLMFAIVVTSSIAKIDWTELGKGFIGWYGIPEISNPKHITLVLGMLGAAVGINMTFLYPYTLLAKGWGKQHKTLARWDLGMSMFLPFTLVTSLVIIAMAVTGVYSGEDLLREKLQPIAAASSLTGILGKHAGRIVFDLGLIAMTCSAISTHMVVCGFTLCEMFGLKYTKARFRLFALAPTIGILGVITKLPFWFPVAASAVCFAMLPIAYVAFLIMNNKRSYIGDAVGKGLGRLVFNLILVAALAMATIGSVIKIKSGVIDKLHDYFAGQKKPAVAAPAEPGDAEKPPN